MRPVQPRSALVRDGLGLASTDVVMNLFLFFVIAFALIATFQKKDPKTQAAAEAQAQQAAAGERVKVIDLPVSATAQAKAPQGALLVELDGAGGLFLEGASVDRSALTAELRRRVGEPKRAVVLRAYKGAALGDTVELLDLITAAEPASVSLSTVEKPDR